GAAGSAARALVGVGAQVALVADAAGAGVDHADRVVVVVSDNQRLAVGGEAQAAGVGLYVNADAFVAGTAGGARGDVSQSNGRGSREAVAALGVDVHRVVTAARGIERVAIRREHEANMRVRLLDH